VKITDKLTASSLLQLHGRIYAAIDNNDRMMMQASLVELDRHHADLVEAARTEQQIKNGNVRIDLASRLRTLAKIIKDKARYEPAVWADRLSHHDYVNPAEVVAAIVADLETAAVKLGAE